MLLGTTSVRSEGSRIEQRENIHSCAVATQVVTNPIGNSGTGVVFRGIPNEAKELGFCVYPFPTPMDQSYEAGCVQGEDIPLGKTASLG